MPKGGLGIQLLGPEVPPGVLLSRKLRRDNTRVGLGGPAAPAHAFKQSVKTTVARRQGQLNAWAGKPPTLPDPPSQIVSPGSVRLICKQHLANRHRRSHLSAIGLRQLANARIQRYFL
jgi:hypothetical protein